MTFSFRRESQEVRSYLVAELANTAVPTSIMGATLVGVVLAASVDQGSVLLGAAGASGGAATLCKLVLMAAQRRGGEPATLPPAHAGRWEAAHMVATLCVASSVSAVASTLLLHPAIQWHLLAAALLFGYCSGVVSRVGIRPRMAVAALLVAALPAIVACASWSDLPHRITALMFGVFLLGSFESVRHVHATAIRHIAMQLDMATLARRDPLTGLVNRLGFREAFRLRAPSACGLAVHCLDLDGFKTVNDRFGHGFGDALLVQVARRLVAEAGPGTSVARLGGDEFAILQSLHGDEDAVRLAEAVVASLRTTFVVEGVAVTIGASLGYVVGASDASDLDDLLRSADLASYRVKQEGGGLANAGVDGNPPAQKTHQTRLRLVM